VLEDDAELHCHWDPIIPFAGSRVARNERWRFGDLAHELRVRVAGVLRYLERYRLVPWDDRSVTRTWMAGDSDYLGTAVLHHGLATAETAASILRKLPPGRAQVAIRVLT
jgi:urease accessory protein UreH